MTSQDEPASNNLCVHCCRRIISQDVVAESNLYFEHLMPCVQLCCVTLNPWLTCEPSYSRLPDGVENDIVATIKKTFNFSQSEAIHLFQTLMECMKSKELVHSGILISLCVMHLFSVKFYFQRRYLLQSPSAI